MPVGAAIAAAGVGGALISASAAKGAANTQAQAATSAAQLQYQQAQLAAQLQLGMFNTIRGDLSPYRAFGGAALPGLSRLLGYGMPAATAPAGSTAVPTTSFSNPAGGGLNIPGLGGGIDPTTGLPGFNAGGMIGGGPAIPKAGDVNYDQLWKDRPDVLREAQRVTGTGEFPTVNAYADWWQQHYGTPSGYQAPTWTQDQLSAAYPNAGGTPGAGQVPGAGGTPTGPSLTPGGDTGSGDIEAFLSSLPGYQFAKQQGLRAVTNSAAAKGLGGPSGAYGKGIARFVTGLADSTYQQQLDNYFRAAGVGQSAANQTGAYGSTAASGASGSLIGGAGALANGLIGSANANASGQVGVANAISGGINSGINGYLTSQVLGMYGGGGAGGAFAQTPLLSGAPTDLAGLY